LEASAEIRQDLFSFVQGALFVDAGNVWYVKTEPVEGGRFNSSDFVSEIAIGSGIGLRLDFDFLVLRFDAGIKTYDPARNPGERWVIRNLSWKRPFGEKNQTVWNIAIGYPF
jgi:outer membrane protein assembly factor BamA